MSRHSTGAHPPIAIDSSPGSDMPPTSSTPFGSEHPSDRRAIVAMHPVPGDLPIAATTIRHAGKKRSGPKQDDRTGGHPAHRETIDSPSGKSRIDSNSPINRQLHPGEAEKDSPSGARPTTIKKSIRDLDDTSSMLKKDIPKVLPLHLAPIDSFFLADDGPRYPMTSVIRLEFRGKIEPAAFEIALDEANERHPLTNAVIRPAKRGQPCWVNDANIRPWVNWGPLSKPVELATEESFDLSKESGMRFWIRSSDSETVITVQVHHACTDGTGVYRFLGDLLALYGQQTTEPGQRIPELADVDPRLLRRRRSRMSNIANSKNGLFKLIRHGCSHCWNIFGKTITPLAIPAETAQPTKSSAESNGQSTSITSGNGGLLTQFPGVVSYQFDKNDHKLLREAAARHGAMLNDLLMAEMFRTIVRWNGAHQGRRNNGWLRIMMPSDLREQEDYMMPATNMTAYTFVTRRQSECTDTESLIKGVREETGKIKHQQLGRGFMDTMEFAVGGKSIMKYVLGRDRCIATTILSNVGDPSKRFTASFPRDGGRIVSGNLTLEDVSGVPPMRIRSHATLAIFSYLRKLTVCVRCDPYRFTKDDATQFMNMYTDGLKMHIADRLSVDA